MPDGPTRNSLAEVVRSLVSVALLVASADPPETDRDLDIHRRDAFVLGAVAGAVELASGVLREVDADASANGLRLARHLFELDLAMNYVAAEPLTRTQQLFMYEASTRIRIAGAFPDATWVDEGFRNDLLRLDQEHRRRRSTARKRKRDPGAAAADEPTWPKFEDQARALGRYDDYEIYYRAASWLSHPGVGLSELHLGEDPAARRGYAAGNSGQVVGESALALAVASLFQVIEAADRLVGPTPGVSERLAEIRASELEP